MPVTPNTLARLTRACSFDYLGEPVTVEYRPAAVGADLVPRLNALMEQAQAADDEATADAATLAVGAFLCDVIAGWDFLLDDGVTPQPVTPENMAILIDRFTHFMQAVILAIVQDRAQGNANGTPSYAHYAATSSPTEKSTPTGLAALVSQMASPNSTDSASSPDGSTEPQALNGSLRTRHGSTPLKSAR